LNANWMGAMFVTDTNDLSLHDSTPQSFPILASQGDTLVSLLSPRFGTLLDSMDELCPWQSNPCPANFGKVDMERSWIGQRSWFLCRLTDKHWYSNWYNRLHWYNRLSEWREWNRCQKLINIDHLIDLFFFQRQRKEYHQSREYINPAINDATKFEQKLGQGRIGT
jgi:hypothetical protein